MARSREFAAAACPGELHTGERRRLPEVHMAMEEPAAGTAEEPEPTSCWDRWDRGARRGPARDTEYNPLLLCGSGDIRRACAYKKLAKRGVCCETSAEEAEPTKQSKIGQ